MKLNPHDRLYQHLKIEPTTRRAEGSATTASSATGGIKSGIAGEPFQIRYTSAVSPAPQGVHVPKMTSYANSTKFPHAKTEMSAWPLPPQSTTPIFVL